MNAINIIDHHQIIRETVGYEVLNQVPIEDMPKVMEFLKIVYNHNRMKRVDQGERERSIRKILQETNNDNRVIEKDLLKSILEDRSNADGHDEDGNPKYKYDGYTYVLNPSCTEIIAVSLMKYED